MFWSHCMSLSRWRSSDLAIQWIDILVEVAARNSQQLSDIRHLSSSKLLFDFLSICSRTMNSTIFFEPSNAAGKQATNLRPLGVKLKDELWQCSRSPMVSLSIVVSGVKHVSRLRISSNLVLAGPVWPKRDPDGKVPRVKLFILLASNEYAATDLVSICSTSAVNKHSTKPGCLVYFQAVWWSKIPTVMFCQSGPAQWQSTHWMFI